MPLKLRLASEELPAPPMVLSERLLVQEIRGSGGPCKAGTSPEVSSLVMDPPGRQIVRRFHVSPSVLAGQFDASAELDGFGHLAKRFESPLPQRPIGKTGQVLMLGLTGSVTLWLRTSSRSRRPPARQTPRDNSVTVGDRHAPGLDAGAPSSA